MSSSTTLNLQHEATAHPVIAGVVVLGVIAIGILAFNAIAAASNSSWNKSRSASSDNVGQAASILTEGDSVDVSINSSNTASTDASGNSSRTSVTVNGQSVPADTTGSVHETFESKDGSSTVNISIDNKQTSSGDSQ